MPDLRLGIVGSLSSGKSALVHRYLTGSYMQEESPEGGRFKKEIVVDGQSYLLLIRDEGGPPEGQVDKNAFLFVCRDVLITMYVHYYVMYSRHGTCTLWYCARRQEDSLCQEPASDK